MVVGIVVSLMASLAPAVRLFGFSASVLGIHWPTDIAAGLATGILAVAVARLIDRSILWPEYP